MQQPAEGEQHRLPHAAAPSAAPIVPCSHMPKVSCTDCLMQGPAATPGTYQAKGAQDNTGLNELQDPQQVQRQHQRWQPLQHNWCRQPTCAGTCASLPGICAREKRREVALLYAGANGCCCCCCCSCCESMVPRGTCAMEPVQATCVAF